MKMKLRSGLSHGSRFHLAALLPGCHWACLHRRYTDSDPGSDIQHDSLLDSVIEDNGCHNDQDQINGNQFINSNLHHHSNNVRRNQTRSVPIEDLVYFDTDQTTDRNITERKGFYLNNNMPTNYLVHNNQQTWPAENEDAVQSTSAEIHNHLLLVDWETQESETNGNHEQTLDNLPSCQASNHGNNDSVPRNSVLAINSDLEDLFNMDSLPRSLTGLNSDIVVNSDSQEMSDDASMSGNVLFSQDRQVLPMATRNFNRWRWHEVLNGNRGDHSETRDQTENPGGIRGSPFRPIMRHYSNMSNLESRIRLENMFDNPQNLQNNSSATTSHTNSLSSHSHITVPEELFSEGQAQNNVDMNENSTTLIPTQILPPPAQAPRTLPEETLRDPPLPSFPPRTRPLPRVARTMSNRSNNSGGSGGSGRVQQQDWYIYDPRLVPQGRTTRMTAETNCGGVHSTWSMPGIINPPSYEEFLETDLQQTGILNPDWPDNLGQQEGCGEVFPNDPPPPYRADIPNEPPPAYEMSFNHALGNFSQIGNFSSLFSDDFSHIPLPYQMIEPDLSEQREVESEADSSITNSETHSSCLSDVELESDVDESTQIDADVDESTQIDADVDESTQIDADVDESTQIDADVDESTATENDNVIEDELDNDVANMSGLDLDDLDTGDVGGNCQGQPGTPDDFSFGRVLLGFGGMRQGPPLRWSRNMRPDRWAPSQMWI